MDKNFLDDESEFLHSRLQAMIDAHFQIMKTLYELQRFLKLKAD